MSEVDWPVELAGTTIRDAYAEAFPMVGCRLIITAATPALSRIAAQEASGHASSVIGCDAEAAIERDWNEGETPDGRPGTSLLLFAFNRESLEKAVVSRVGNSVMTCPTTNCFCGLPDSDKRVSLGGRLRFFGDGWQISKVLNGTRYWRIPVMDGEFVCQETLGTQKGVGGGNFLVLANTQLEGLVAAQRAAAAIANVDGAIAPFPGGIVRSGSKVGSRYKTLKASTNDAYCPTLRGVRDSLLPAGVNAVYEIVIDGLTLTAVKEAMRRGIQAACGPGVVEISAGNYGGKLGPHLIHLKELMSSSSHEDRMQS